MLVSKFITPWYNLEATNEANGNIYAAVNED